MNAGAGAWLNATLKARIVAVKREVVVRHILRDSVSPRANIKLLLAQVLRFEGDDSVCRQVPDEVFEALSDLADGERNSPCGRTIQVWVLRYVDGGLSALLPRYRGRK